MTSNVAVIGSGPAGLAAAWELTGAGFGVTLYDRATEPGGLLRTSELAGAPVDIAVQLLGSYYRETLRLAREAGGASLLVRAPGRDALWRGGRVHAISYGSVASMAISGALPTGLKLQLASRYLHFLRQHSRILDPADPVRALSLDNESIAEWGEREMGADFVELLAYPQLAAYYGGAPEEISAGFYHSLARAGLDLQLYAIRGGMQLLAELIAQRLEERGAIFQYGVEVDSIQFGTGPELSWSGGSAQHDAVVLAVPAPAALGIAGLPDQVREWLEGVRFAPEIALALTLENAPRPDYFGLSFPRTSAPGKRVAAICMQAGKGADLTHGDRAALIAVPAPHIQAELSVAEPREALDTLLPAIEMAQPQISERVVRARVHRFPHGRAIFYPGYLAHLASFDRTWLPPRLALAGDYLVSPTVEGAVFSGRRAAHRLLKGKLSR